MKRVWQVASVLGICLLLPVMAEESTRFTWKPLANSGVGASRDFGMLDSERDEYATHLASHAANVVIEQKASAASLTAARQMIALAFQLSPRNKRAVVVNFQLAKGVIPEKSDGVLGSQAFARLLLARAQLLEKQGGAENTGFARIFTALAAEIDPRNEDAIYASELHRLDHGAVDWSKLAAEADETP